MRMDEFWVLRVRRQGAPIPRWQQSQASWVEGLLAIREERDEQLNRSFLVARLRGHAGQSCDSLPALFDARLLQLTSERLVLGGFERDPLTGRDTAQTWLLMRGAGCPQGFGLVWEAQVGKPSRAPQTTEFV